jgi:putative membrane protein
MNMRIMLTAVLAACALGLAGPGLQASNLPAPAKTGKTASTAKVAVKTISDADFVKAAAEGGLAEVKLGQLAEDKAQTQAIKDFAKRMLTDHTKAGDDLKTIASKENITLPAQLDAKDQAVYDRLSKLSGKAFDRAYARDMVRDHLTDVAEFRHEASDGKDSSVKSFASATLPTLEDHLKQARENLRSVSPRRASTANPAKKQHS